MIAAHRPVQRPPDARLLMADSRGHITHTPRARFVDVLRPGDLVIANDAATLPASLHGVHLRTGADIEVRLAGWSPAPLVLGCRPGPVDPALLAAPIGPAPRDGNFAAAHIDAFTAVVFGAGDFHTRTEDRPLPPPLVPGDRLVFGSATDGTLAARGESRAAFDGRCIPGGCVAPPSNTPGILGRRALPAGRLARLGATPDFHHGLLGAGRGDRPLVAGDVDGPLGATIEALLDHPRLVRLRFGGSAHRVWAGLARHGRPIQYAHVTTPLAMWDVWTPIAGVPAAFEPPSAGFALDWRSIRVMRERGIGFATITLAAGLSSTGDPALDQRLPFDEAYRIPAATAAAIFRARAEGRRIIAVGTTVVRGLEHAAALDGVVHPGAGIADQRIGPDTRLRIVDALLSGTHESGGSHYQILRAFLDDRTLADADAVLEAQGYRTHEFGDSVLVERMPRGGTAVAGRPREDCIAPAA